MLKLNNCQFTGYLGADFDVRNLENGNTVATANLAVDDSYKDKNGEWQNRTHWVKLVLWNKTAEYASGKFRKGDHLFVECKYTSREYTDKESIKRTAVEFVVSSIQGTQKNNPVAASNSGVPVSHGAGESDITPSPDDDLPF